MATDLPSKQTPEDRLREELLNVAAVIERLALYCERSADLLAVVQLALDSEGQLKILMKVLGPDKR